MSISFVKPAARARRGAAPNDSIRPRPSCIGERPVPATALGGTLRDEDGAAVRYRRLLRVIHLLG